MTPESSIVDPASLSQPRPNAEVPAPEANLLPKDLDIENYSQLRRLARHLFGVGVRVGEKDGEHRVVVDGVLLGADKDRKAALESALKKGTELKLVRLKPRNVVEDARIRVLLSQPDSKRDAIYPLIAKLQDHEVLEAARLNQACTEGKMESRDAALADLQKLLTRAGARQ